MERDGDLNNLRVTGVLTIPTFSLTTPGDRPVPDIGAIMYNIDNGGVYVSDGFSAGWVSIIGGAPLPITNTTPSTSCNTGALTVAGGVGIAGNVNICGTLAVAGGVTFSSGLLLSSSASVPSKLSFTVGAGIAACVGTATLVAGAATVSTAAVDTASLIYLSFNTAAGTQGFLSAPSASIVNGVSFAIHSSSVTDTSTVNWLIVN